MQSLQKKVVVVCSDSNGSPAFVAVNIKMSERKRDLGMHYEAAEKVALENSYERPMICFDDTEMPDFLRKAVAGNKIAEL